MSSFTYSQDVGTWNDKQFATCNLRNLREHFSRKFRTSAFSPLTSYLLLLTSYFFPLLSHSVAAMMKPPSTLPSVKKSTESEPVGLVSLPRR